MSAARIRVTAGPDVTNASRLAIGDEVDVDRFDVSGGAWVRVDEGDVYTLSRDWFDIIEVLDVIIARLPDLLMEVDGLREVVATLNGEVARLNDLRSMHEMAALEAELTIRRLTKRTALTLDDLVLIGEKAMRRETWKVPHLFAKAIVDALGVELPEATR